MYVSLAESSTEICPMPSYDGRFESSPSMISLIDSAEMRDPSG